MNASLGLSALLSIFVHSIPRGMILDAPNVGLPCFRFPRGREIALACEFSSWLVIAGNALF